MAWSVVRKATQEDTERLAAIHRRFAARYHVELLEVTPDEVEAMLDALERHDWELGHYLNGLLRRAIRRAGLYEGIAWGYVGFHVE